MNHTPAALAICLAVGLLAIPGQTAFAQPPLARLDADGDPLPPDAIYRLGTKAWRDCVAGESLAFSPDGRQLAYIRRFREVRILDAQSGKIVRTLRPDDAGADVVQYIQCAWSPDGSEIALRARPSRILILDLATGRQKQAVQLIVEHDHDTFQPHLRYSPNGRLLAAAFSSTYAVIDKTSGEIIVQEKDQRDIRSLEFASGGSLLLVATTKPPVKIWDLTKREIVNRWTPAEADAIRAATISPDGRLAAIACPNMVVVDLASGRAVTRQKIEGDVEELLEVAFTPDSRRLIAASRFVHVWNTNDWSQAVRLTDECYFNVTDIAIRPDGQRVAICDGNRIWNWDLTAGKLLEDSVPAHHGAVSANDFSPNGKLFATGSYGKDTHLWDAPSGRHLRSLPTPGIGLSFSADGTQLVTTFVTAPHIRTWETATGRLLKEWSARDEYLNSYTFSADRKRAAVLHNQLPQHHALETFELPALEAMTKFEREGHAWAGILLSPDGSTAAVHGREIELLDLKNGKTIGSLIGTSRANGPLAFTADGRFALIRMPDKSIGVWELASLSLAHLLKGHKGTPAAIALAPSGRFLASGDYTLNSPEALAEPRQIRFWDLRTGKQIAALTGHDADVSSLAFSPAGAMLISGHQDSTVLSWKLPSAVIHRDTPDLPLSMNEASQRWTQLAEADAQSSQSAIARLAESPLAALELLERRLNASHTPADADLQPLIARLDSDDFAERRAAVGELARYGQLIAPSLRKIVEQSESAEVRLRCQELLHQAAQQYPQSASRLQETRAVQLLEWIGNERAVAMLRKLATGAREAHLTHEANAALARLPK